MEDFPGNSHASKVQSQEKPEPEKPKTANSEPKKAQKVVTGKAQKKPIGQRFRQMFASDGQSFGEHLVEHVIIPGIKELILATAFKTLDGLKEGVEQSIFGDSKPRTTRTTSYGTGRPQVQYNRFSSPATSRPHPPGQAPRIIRRSNVIEDIILPTRADGEAVKEELQAVIDSVGHCTVGDLYSTVDIQPNKTDEGWGWDDISAARVRMLPTGEFLLVMPRPIPIEN